MLRSGMMGWLTIMTDTIAWTPEQHEAARQAISLYKSELRPLIRDAKLYHVSDRPDGVHWDAIEYYDSARGKGVVYAFRGSVADEPEHRFRLEGLQADTRYRLHFADGGVADRVATGSELMGPGLKVSLPHSLSSALVFLNRSTTRIEEVSK
jgi:alpha-galactosidase